MIDLEHIRLSTQQAKTFLLNYHMINTSSPLEGTSGILEVFNRIQSIQYDPLDVVGKNTDLVIQSRVQNYTKGHINQLLYSERVIIDGWDKQMCVFQTKDFPYMHSIRHVRSEASRQSILKHLQFDVLNYQDGILQILQEEGPKFSTELAKGASKKYYWGNTRPSNLTLDYLFHKGIIGIKQRKNTQKQYDLISNLVPQQYRNNHPFQSEEEFLEYYLLRRIKSMGLSFNLSGEHFLSTTLRTKKTRTLILQRLIAKDAVKMVIIEGIKEPVYIVSDYQNYAAPILNKVSFIAPLDNLIWDRKLLKQLFDFDYTWEVYTPQKKRKYGYYVLPIIYGTEFIGRIEFALQRKKEPLTVLNIWFESHHKHTKDFDTAFSHALQQFATYLGTTIDVIDSVNMS